MEIPQELFQIDINQLIGKLHLAGQQQIPNTVVINTGIVNPTAKPDPANPSDTKFSTASKSGEYQIAFARKLIYKPQIDVTANPKYKEAEKLKEKAKADKEKQTVTDDAKKTEAEDEKVKKLYLDVFKQYGLSYDEDKEDFDKTRKSFQDALKEENEKRKADYEKKAEALKSEIAADAQKYFELFAGSDASQSVKSEADSADLVDLDDDGSLSDPTKFDYKKYVKDFEFDLQAIAEDVEEAREKNKAKPAKEVAKTAAIVLKFEVNTK